MIDSPRVPHSKESPRNLPPPPLGAHANTCCKMLCFRRALRSHFRTALYSARCPAHTFRIDSTGFFLALRCVEFIFRTRAIHHHVLLFKGAICLHVSSRMVFSSESCSLVSQSSHPCVVYRLFRFVSFHQRAIRVNLRTVNT